MQPAQLRRPPVNQTVGETTCKQLSCGYNLSTDIWRANNMQAAQLRLLPVDQSHAMAQCFHNLVGVVEGNGNASRLQQQQQQQGAVEATIWCDEYKGICSG